jgi:hypothetical protein
MPTSFLSCSFVTGGKGYASAMWVILKKFLREYFPKNTGIYISSNSIKKILMKTNFTKLLLIFPAVFIIAMTSCSGNNNGDGKENNEGNHSTEPALPSDAEYPGSKLYDSIHNGDSTHHQ